MPELDDLLEPFTFALDDPSSQKVRLDSGTEGGDKRSRADDPDDDDEGGGGTVDRGKLRAERRAKRQVDRENHRLRREVEELRERQTNTEDAVFDGRVAEARRSLEANQAAARARLKAAKDDQDSDAEVLWLEKLTEVNQELKELDGRVRAAKAERQAAPGSQAGRPKRNDALEAWKDDNDWFDAEPGGFKAKAAMAMSEILLAEGYAPDDPEHFKELDRRLRKEMPTQFKGGKRAAKRDDDDDDLDVPGTAGRGRMSSRGDDDDDDRRGGVGEYNRAQMKIWKMAVPDFDPKNPEHVKEFRKYHDEVRTKNNRRTRRG